MATPITTKVELHYDGVWNDVTAYTMVRTDQGFVGLGRGRPNEAQQTQPSNCNLMLNNRDGRFSPRNPTSPLFGKIGRNTPLRVSAVESVDTAPAFDAIGTVTSGTGNLSWTHTPAAGSPAGILVLIAQGSGITDEVTGVTYGGIAMTEVTGSPLAADAGAETGALYAYFLGENVPAGAQAVVVSVNGTGSTKDAMSISVTADSTTTVVEDTTTLDSAGTADPSVTLTTTVKTYIAGVLLSGHDSTASTTPAAGYIAGSTLDFGTQIMEMAYAAGAASAGSPTIGWTATSEEAAILGIAIKNGPQIARFTGEVAKWPQMWDSTGTDIWVPIEAAGIMRRLGQGSSPPANGLKNTILGLNPRDYWPLDDSRGARDGVNLGRVGGLPHFKNTWYLKPRRTPIYEFGVGDLDYLGTGLQITLTDTGEDLYASTVYANIATDLAVDFVWRTEDLYDLVVGLYSFEVGGSTDVYLVSLLSDDTIDVTRRVITGSSVVDTPLDSTAAFSSIFTDKQVHHFRFQLSENGSNLDWALYIDGSVVLSGTVNSQACDGLVEVRLNAGDASNDIPVTFGHLVVWADGASAFDPPGIPALADMVLAASQYNNETAGRRIERLCSENDIVFSYDGDLDDTMPLGRQNEDNLLSAFHAAAEADGGMLIEPRNHLGLHYITKSALYNRAVDATLDYTSGVFSQVPIPVDDDAYTRNDVTVNGGSGGSARAIQETGPLSIEDPPDGVGRYDTSVQVNVGHESLLSNQASWRLSLGTIDEPRFPSVPIGMHHPSVSDDAALKASILGIDTGSRIQITNIPTWVSFNTLDLLALAVNERFNGFLWYLELVCAPFFPYLVGEYEAAEGETYRYDTAGSSLASSFESGVDTSMSVDIDILPLWTTDGDEVPFDIECGGVRLTVTAISGASSPQTFTITQTPVNGVEKVIPAGTAVSLWTKARYGL